MKPINSALSAAALLAIAMFIPAGSVHAQVEGFESGTTGTNIGDVSNRTPIYFGIVPTEGTHMLLLTTINNSLDGGAQQSSAAAEPTPSVMQTFVGATAVGFLRNSRVGQLASATGRDGSAFKLTLGPLSIGDVISFDINFLTSDTADTTNDFAFFTLNGATSNVPVIADTSDAGSIVPLNGSPFNLQSGWQTVTINITSAASYTLAIGIMDAANSAGASGLLIDNITITPVPEPSTVAFGIAGAVLLIALRSRFKKA